MAPRALAGALLIAGAAGCGKDPSEPIGTGDPVITIEAPVSGGTANGTIRIKASCAGACRSLEVYTEPASMYENVVMLARGGRSIDREISLGGLSGPIALVFSATDGGTRSDFRRLDVYAMNASDVTEVVRTPGPVLDFDGMRVLYADSTAEGWRIWLGTGNPASDRLLRTGGRPDSGVTVNPDLALFTVWRNPTGPSIIGARDPIYPDTDSLFEWRSGTASLLSATSLTRRPRMGGGVAAWQDGIISTATWSAPERMPLQVRDLAAGTTTTVSTSSGAFGIDVGAGPSVAWADRGGEGTSAPPEIVWWRNGAITRFTGDAASGGYLDPKTDGTLLAFQTLRCCRVELQGPQGRQVLAEYEPPSGHYRYRKYDVEGGFVAFTRRAPGAAADEVILRRPGGTMLTAATPVVLWDLRSIGLLTSTGALVYNDVLLRPEVAARMLGSAGAEVVERNGMYYLIYGNAVYRVN